MEHYFYALLDPRKPGIFVYTLSNGEHVEFDHEPFYVGKGLGQRAYEHVKDVKNTNYRSTHKNNVIAKILRQGKEPIVRISHLRYTEDDALSYEIMLITAIGRQDLDLGPLTNKTDGGEGLRNASIEVLDRISKSVKLFHKNLTPEQREEWKRKTKEGLASMTEAEVAESHRKRRATNEAKPEGIKRQINIRRSKSARESWDSKSYNAKLRHIENSAKAQKEYYATLSPEQKRNRIKKTREALDKANAIRTENERRVINAKRSIGVKEARATWSEEERAAFSSKMSQELLSRDHKSMGEKRKARYAAKPKIVCPHCGKEGTYPKQMDTYHFNNCKKFAF